MADSLRSRAFWWLLHKIDRWTMTEIEKRTCCYSGGCDRQVARVESTSEDDSEWYCVTHQEVTNGR